MTDLISRADAIDAVRYLIYDRQEKGAKPFKWWFIKQRLNAIPSAEAKQGKWLTDKGKSLMICSVCGTLFNKHTDFFDFEEFANFCPYCGARMKGGAE